MIIAPCSTNVINTLAANVVKNNLKIVNIPPPDFGYRQHELMQDIAISVGATYFSEKTGDDLSLMTFDDLGHCAKVIVSRDSSVIIKDEVEVLDDSIKTRVGELQAAHSLSSQKKEKEFIMSRIASLTGGIGVVYVGGNTDLEQKELYDRVDDAVCAVNSALEEGIIPGGGLMLQSIACDYGNRLETETDKSKLIAYRILSSSLISPMVHILRNAGIDYDDVSSKVRGWKYGYDVKNDRYGYLMSLGVIDPVKVTRSALQNAISVAITILSTDAIVTMARSYETS
jgi:chaperonin GroEL